MTPPDRDQLLRRAKEGLRKERVHFEPNTNQKEHHMLPRTKQFLALALVVAAAAVCLSLSACSLRSTASGGSPAVGSHTLPAAKQPAVTGVTAKACIDATASSNSEFADGVRQDLVDALSSWVSPLPSGSPTAAVAATPGLSFFVRQVYTNSYSTQVPALDLQIPGTTALPAPPKISDPNLPTDQLVWANREQQWRATVKRALAAEAAAVAALKSYPLDDAAGNWSAISGCTAALVGEGTQSGSVRMLLASDLQENRPPVSANYEGASLVIDQNYPGSPGSCSSLAGSWKARFRRQGMGSVRFVRADAATQTIENWLLGGRS